jgi:hypothetical protein
MLTHDAVHSWMLCSAYRMNFIFTYCDNYVLRMFFRCEGHRVR